MKVALRLSDAKMVLGGGQRRHPRLRGGVAAELREVAVPWHDSSMPRDLYYAWLRCETFGTSFNPSEDRVESKTTHVKTILATLSLFFRPLS